MKLTKSSGAFATKRIGMLAAAMLMVAAATVYAQDVQELSTPDQSSNQASDQAQDQSSPPQQGSVGLVNQMSDLQAQLQQMEGKLEELQHQVDQLQQQNKNQYTDLDSRIGKLEAGGAAPASSTSPVAASSSAPASATGATAPVAAASTNAPAAPNADEQAAYNAAFKSLQGGNYVAAARAFRGYTQKYPDGALAPNAYYWLGESYYVTQNYQVALDTFQTLLKKYPQSEKSPDALLKVGYCQAEMKNVAAARATLNAVIKKYPKTTVARLAESRLRSLKLQSAK